MSLLKATVVFILISAVSTAPAGSFLTEDVNSCIEWFYTAAETRNISCLGEYDFLSVGVSKRWAGTEALMPDTGWQYNRTFIEYFYCQKIFFLSSKSSKNKVFFQKLL